MNYYDARKPAILPIASATLARLPAQVAPRQGPRASLRRAAEGRDRPPLSPTRGAGHAAGDPAVRFLNCRRPRGPSALAAVRWGSACARVFASPGADYEPEGARKDYWRLARAFYAAGFRAGDLVHNTFSYHFTPAGSMMELPPMRWAARCSRRASARPKCSLPRCSTCAPMPTPARRLSCASCWRKPTSRA